MKLIIITSVGMLFALGRQTPAHESQTGQYSQKTPIKNWALSRCLAEVYKDGSAKDDANATAGAYLEFGRQPIEAYDELNKVVDEYANRSLCGLRQVGFQYHGMH